MTLAEFKELTRGKTEVTLSPLEWDELRPHADPDRVQGGQFVGAVENVLIYVDPSALATWEQARLDDAAREKARRAEKAAADKAAAEAAELAALKAKAEAKRVSDELAALKAADKE